MQHQSHSSLCYETMNKLFNLTPRGYFTHSMNFKFSSVNPQKIIIYEFFNFYFLFYAALSVHQLKNNLLTLSVCSINLCRLNFIVQPLNYFVMYV
jgi:hypothetical protein